MNETLFLVCPSDCLEARINEQFNTVNYFYTSLGNSFNIDQGSLKNIQELITNHSIKNIYFVLSSDNRFILDALEGHSITTDPLTIKGLIFNSLTNNFLPIYSNLTIINKHQLN